MASDHLPARVFKLAFAWLLMVSVSLGANFNPSDVATAGSDACNEACPCAEAAHEPFAAGDGVEEAGTAVETGLAAQPGTAGSSPCSDDCSDCGCCRGLTMAMATALALPECAVPRASLLVPDFIALLPCSTASDVFRPPRILL